jgi:hypothetical protein
MTQWLVRMRTISRSKSTVVVIDPWERATRGQPIQQAIAYSTTVSQVSFFTAPPPKRSW